MILSIAAQAAGTITYVKFTTLAETEIGAAGVVYTHAIDPGIGADTTDPDNRNVINSIPFNSYHSPLPQYAIPNFSATSDSLFANSTISVPAFGAGLSTALSDLMYSFSSITLSGLQAGTTYDFRMYVRDWGSDNRTNTLTLTGGVGAPTVLTFNQDNTAGNLPDAKTGTNITDGSYYYINYRYTAAADLLNVSLVNTPGFSFHVYALTNQVAVIPEASNSLLIAAGAMTIGLRRRCRLR